MFDPVAHLLLLKSSLCEHFLMRELIVSGFMSGCCRGYQQLTAYKYSLRNCRKLDLNWGPIVSEVIALPTEPQPHPRVQSVCLPINHFDLFSFCVLGLKRHCEIGRVVRQ